MFRAVVLLLLVFFTEHGSSEDGTDSTGAKAADSKSYNFPEFDRIAAFLRPLVDQAENDRCRKQLQSYVKSFRNSSLWAVQMFDASAKVPQGLLTSDAYDLGNYDGCLEINLRRPEGDNIFGKYCLASVSILEDFHSTESLRPGDVFVEPEISTWEKLMVPVFKYGFINDVFRSAICVPNECTPRDVENILRYLYDNATKLIGRRTRIWVSENSCSTKEGNDHVTADLIKKTISVLFLWVAISTIFDLVGCFRGPKEGWTKIFKTFSAYKNVQVLASVDCPEHVPVLNSVKVYAFVMLVTVRRLSFFLTGPIVNRKAVDEVFRHSFREGFFDVANHSIADAFLVLDGFLHFHKVYSHFRSDSRISIWRIYLLEYCKTVPLYVLAILFYGHVLETVGNGPVWKERTGDCVGNCKENWIPNLLFINNLINKNKMCIFESWYFAVIAQCFVSIPIVVRVMIKSSTTGIALLGLLTATALALPLASPHYALQPYDASENDSELEWHKRIQVGTVARGLPYFIGVCSSLAYTRIKERRWTFSKAFIKRFALFAAGFCVVSLSVLYSAHPEAILQKAFINTLRQLILSLTLSGIVVGVSTKQLPSLTPVFEQKYIFLLGRLSYSYLLVLGLVQLYTTGIIRTLDYFSLPRLVWMSAADLLASWIFAFIFYMIVHRPASNILHEKILGEPKKCHAKDHNFESVKPNLKCKKKIKYN